MDRHPAFQRCAGRLLLGLFVFASAGCSASLFKVKPVNDLSALSASAKTVEAGGVRASVAALLSDEESQDLFEANLPLGGVLPVRIEVAYHPNGDGSPGTPTAALPLELKRIRLRLRDGEGHEWKPLSTKKAIGRILKTNGVSLYNPYFRKQFEKDFSAYAIDLKTPLPATEQRRQGFLFFQTPDKSPVRSPHGLVLSISGLPQPLQITID